MNKQLFENAKLVTMDSKNTVMENGYILVDKGIIVEIGKKFGPKNKQEIKVSDLKGSIVVPGLINAHSHSYSNMVKGTTENLPLEIWMLYVMAEGKEMSNDDVYVSSLLGSIEQLKGGITSFLDHLAQPKGALLQAARAYEQAGIRAWVTPMFADKNYGNTLPENLNLSSTTKNNLDEKELTKQHIETLEETYSELKKYSDNIHFGIGPSAPHRCTDSLIVASYELAEKLNVPWHTHVLETKIQNITSYTFYQKSMIKHLEALGVLSSRSSLAHVVYADKDDIDLLADNHVSVVHNPTSNLLLGSGIMPLTQMKEAGVNIALGTDGANCCGYQSMFESMKLAAILSNTNTSDFSRWLTASQILQMATINSAKALGKKDVVGSLEKGKKADFIVLDPQATNFVPLNNIIWQLIYGRADLTITDVYISGKPVVRNGKITKFDEKEVYDEAIERGRSLLKRLNINYENIKKDQVKVKSLIERLKSVNLK